MDNINPYHDYGGQCEGDLNGCDLDLDRKFIDIDQSKTEN